MTRACAAGAIALVLVGALALASGCSAFTSGNPTLDEGARLEVTDHATDLPTSRAGYAAMVTFTTPGGAIQIVDPGTGPADPPRLLRTLRLERHIVNEAQIADDGYLWVASPDFEGGTLRVVYVVDPYAGTVHRAIETPPALSAIAGLTVGPDDVYVYAWRSGPSGAVGAVPRACASASRVCDVRLLAEFANVGLTPERALHYERGRLYSFSLGRIEENKPDETARLDPATGRMLGMYPFTGSSTFDADDFYIMILRGPGQKELVRVDKETLQEEDRQPIGINAFQIAYDAGKLYVTDGVLTTVEVYDAATLDRVEVIDGSAGIRAGSPEAGVGFLASGVLMLTHRAWLNTETKRVVTDAFPLQENFSHAPRQAQGQPFAW